MEIILVATGAKGKNVVFVTDTLKAYPLEEAVRLAKAGKFENVYTPDQNDPRLSPDKIRKTSRAHLYQYVKEPKHSIFFAAAKMRLVINGWKKFVDLNARPEIIATLYHLPHRDPHANPQANERGVQIANEFYRLAKEWLR